MRSNIHPSLIGDFTRTVLEPRTLVTGEIGRSVAFPEEKITKDRLTRSQVCLEGGLRSIRLSEFQGFGVLMHRGLLLY